MSARFRQFEVHPNVVSQAQQLGLFGNVEKRIARMARRSAPFTHEAGNRRFEGFILRIEKGVVTSIRKFDPDTGEVVSDVMGRLSKEKKTIAAIQKHFGGGAASKK